MAVEKTRCGHGEGPLRRCVNVALFARNVPRHGRKETATLAMSLYVHINPCIENNMVPLPFSKDQEF
jgi:hypothetical protein